MEGGVRVCVCVWGGGGGVIVYALGAEGGCLSVHVLGAGVACVCTCSFPSFILQQSCFPSLSSFPNSLAFLPFLPAFLSSPAFPSFLPSFCLLKQSSSLWFHTVLNYTGVRVYCRQPGRRVKNSALLSKSSSLSSSGTVLP